MKYKSGVLSFSDIMQPLLKELNTINIKKIIFYAENRGNTSLENVGNRQNDYKASQARRPPSTF